MPFQRPTLSDLITRVTSDFVTRLSLVGSVLRRSFIYVISRVTAGAFHELYGQLDFLSRQIIVDTAEGEYLERHGASFRVNKKEATFAIGSVTFSGENGKLIPEGTILQRADLTQYVTTADVTTASLTATVNVE